MATFTVTNTNDSGAGSLHDAIAQANASVGVADTIEFAPSLSGQTIRLGSGAEHRLRVNENAGALTIDGDIDNDGVADITISGDVSGDDTTIAGTSITNLVGTAATELDDNVQILSSGADLTLDGLVLTGGIATGTGGAVRGAGIGVTVNVTLINSTVSGNGAETGGGIFASGTATLTNTTVSDNTATTFGGGIAAVEAANLTGTTVSGNRAGVDGGGVYASAADLTNVTISGNRAGSDGGGIYSSGAAALTNTTVSGNLAANDGGGISATTTANLTNSIVLGNDAAAGEEVSGATTLTGGNIVGTHLFQDSTDLGIITHDVFAAVGNNPHTGVLSGVLADNGGPVQTIALSKNVANPALDASNGSALTTDARGNARFDNAGIANTNGSAADLGAYELQNPSPTVTINEGPGQSDPVNAGPIVFDVLFSEAVTGFDSSDISFAGSTVGGTLSANVSGSGAHYTVSVTGMSGTGIVVASIDAGAADVGGFSSEASTSIDNTVTFDGVAPTVTLNQGVSQSDPVSAGPIVFDVVFSEAVTGFDASDISFAGSTVGGVLAASVSGSGTSYTVSVTGMSGAGAVVASIGAGAAQDAAGNASAASTSTDNSVNVSGVTIFGTNGKDLVDATHTVPGQPSPSEFGDSIFGLGDKDKLSGLGGDDSMDGGKDKDTLLGGDGKDSFVFSVSLKQKPDTIGDFVSADDTIELALSVFKKLALGALSDAAFRDIGEKATNDTRITYKSNGELSYDKDGKGGADAVVFAKLATKPDIDASDFLVVA